MAERKRVECYVEEYRNETGMLTARLREKETGRRVELGFTDRDGKTRLVLFLSSVRRRAEAWPNVFEKDGRKAYIEIDGDVEFDTPDEITYLPKKGREYSVQVG
jgi:hypothetical protein